jgi:hypothetical protein
MKKYQQAEVSESDLEDLVRRAPDLIEDGLKFVDHQTSTPRGPLDVLMCDSGNALVLAELKVVENDAMLLQAIDYYDHLVRNVEGFARAYSSHEIDPTQPIRMFLIAPSFSVATLNRIKWIDIPISLFTYQCIKFEDDDEVTPIYKELSPPSAPERIEVPTLEANLKYITDDDVRETANKALEEIKSWSPDLISVEPIKSSISIKYGGRVLAYLETRRKHFLISGNDDSGQWTSHKVETGDDLELALNRVQVTYRNLSGS